MKKFFIALALFLVAFVALVGLSGAARATSTAKALPAVSPTVTDAELGLGKGDCFYDGATNTFGITKPSCVGMNPPPESSCNPNGLQNSTLDVLHEVRDKIDIGGFAEFYIFQSDAGGCGSGWSAVNVYAGCHTVSQISIADSFNNSTAGGIDTNGKLVCPGQWESSKMVDAESGSTLTAKVIVDFQPQQSASVTV